MTPIEEKLLAIACEQTRLSREEILAVIADPCWDKAQQCHDWRNHVDDDLRPLWPFLSPDAKLVAFLSSANGAALTNAVTLLR